MKAVLGLSLILIAGLLLYEVLSGHGQALIQAIRTPATSSTSTAKPTTGKGG